ncbi:hypothetical protein LCM17_03285 [Cereibacter sphaeroides]|nr:hypothetical protein [Cereibacter sphaeroides]
MKRALAVALLLAACTPSDDVPAPDRLDAAARAQCEAAGGMVMTAGLSGHEFCAARNSDAGQSCSRATDCDGYCEAETRQCSTYQSPFGCYAFLNADGERIDICVD